MKYLLPILLLIVFVSDVSAKKRSEQTDSVILSRKHHVFADIGGPVVFSVTYNYKVSKYLSMGAGVQGEMFAPPLDSFRLVPGLFTEIRLNIMPVRRNQLFLFYNLGANFYKQNKTYFPHDSVSLAQVPHNNGLNVGFGFGYLRRMTKHGGGLYLALKITSNFYRIRGYSIISDEQRVGDTGGDTNPSIALGFKF